MFTTKPLTHIFSGHRTHATFWIIAAFTALGVGLYNYHAQHQAFDNLYQQFEGQKLFITATVKDVTNITNQRFKKQILLRTSQINTTPYNCAISLYTNDWWMRVGDTIELKNVQLRKPKDRAFIEYMIKEGTIATLFTPRPDYKRTSRPIWSLRRALVHQREKLLVKLKKSLSPQTFALVTSIFLGNKRFVKEEMSALRDQWNAWGLAHQLARSGLHLMIFIFLWTTMLGFVPCSFKTKQTILIMLCLAYWAISWTSISFSRALMTFVLYKLCNLLTLPVHGLHLWILVFAITATVNPTAIFFLDFQLSFALTGALIWFYQAQRSAHRKTP
ncbi:hypothetical protein HOK96_04245 [bacterium]|nr:hypothetical protein [bacterium]MBT3903793.1 hypothetical protein [bacterium]MBT4578100.1 hypothetical protein [bacterium]MBT5346230.1 hypothetical protein [bacterium]MBT6131026.1 hypothetical protein [bacterium]